MKPRWMQMSNRFLTDIPAKHLKNARLVVYTTWKHGSGAVITMSNELEADDPWRVGPQPAPERRLADVVARATTGKAFGKLSAAALRVMQAKMWKAKRGK